MSKSQQIIALAQSGVPPKEIAERLDTSRNCVKVILSQARQRGVPIMRFTRGPAQNPRMTVNRASGPQVVIPNEIISEIRPHALARLVTPGDIVRRLVETIVDDGLIGAILDDGVEA